MIGAARDSRGVNFGFCVIDFPAATAIEQKQHLPDHRIDGIERLCRSNLYVNRTNNSQHD